MILATSRQHWQTKNRFRTASTIQLFDARVSPQFGSRQCLEIREYLFGASNFYPFSFTLA